MTRGQYFGTVMPVWAILYVIGIVAFKNHTFNVVGALVFALLAVIGTAVLRGRPVGPGGVGRARSARAERRAARRA